MSKLISRLRLLPVLFLLLAAHPAGASDARVFEMRTYYAPPGKLAALEARFRDHTLRLFEKHGIANIGYWVPVENPDNKLIYVLAYPSREAREQAWKSFFADPDWKAVVKASEANGKLVAKVDQLFLKATDYSPVIQPSKSAGGRVFELRIYTTNPGKLDDLNARFRNHTTRLFERHGIANVAYWTPMDKDKGADNTLVYVVAHASQDAAKASWAKFGQDPDWKRVREASEQNGKILAQKPELVFMKPTDFSPIK